jgi:hypothetical protein
MGETPKMPAQCSDNGGRQNARLAVGDFPSRFIRLFRESIVNGARAVLGVSWRGPMGSTLASPAGPTNRSNEDSVKTRLFYLAACAAAASLALPLRAEDTGTHASAQREKFAACAHETRGMKPEQHREDMSECMKKRGGEASHPAAEAANGGHLEPCNAEADRKKLHGDERSAFVAACLRT